MGGVFGLNVEILLEISFHLIHDDDDQLNKDFEEGKWRNPTKREKTKDDLIRFRGEDKRNDSTSTPKKTSVETMLPAFAIYIVLLAKKNPV